MIILLNTRPRTTEKKKKKKNPAVCQSNNYSNTSNNGYSKDNSRPHSTKRLLLSIKRRANSLLNLRQAKASSPYY